MLEVKNSVILSDSFMTPHVHFQVTSWLHTQTQVLLPNSGTPDFGEENASAATSVSSPPFSGSAPKALVQNTTQLRLGFGLFLTFPDLKNFI